MMNKLQLFIFLVCICMLAGCTEEEENSGIRLIEGTASGQTIFADETTTDGDINFTTDGAWTAEVTEASTKAEGSSVSWVTLDKYSGNAAGEYTITVFVRKNYTGADRKAYIRITCGSRRARGGSACCGFRSLLRKLQIESDGRACDSAGVAG